METMFAIIETGGKQYKVEKGETLDVERLEEKEGASINFDKVLLVHDGKETSVGTPVVNGASVSAKIVAHKRGEKILVFKMKAKKRYQKTQGHRQELTTIEISDIKASGAKAAKSTSTTTPKTPSTPKKPAVKKAPSKKKESS